MDALLHRLGVLHQLVRELGDSGKIKIQKLTYFLQEAFTVQLGYSFRMHHYGPYSEQIEGDLATLRSMGYVRITPDAAGYGFHVIATPEGDLPWPVVSTGYQDAVRRVVNLFGSHDSTTLELYATIHFVRSILGDVPSREVLKAVSHLKPGFSDHRISQGYDELAKERLLPS